MNLIEFQTAKGKAQPRGLGHSSEQMGDQCNPMEKHVWMLIGAIRSGGVCCSPERL